MSMPGLGFRQANTWLHTWSGVLVAWLLYLIFFTGALSFFRVEINTWAQPELLRIQQNDPADAWHQAQNYLQTHALQSPEWFARLPDERQPALFLRWFDKGEVPSKRGGHQVLLNPTNGEKIQTRETRLGDFLYRMHFELYGMPRSTARWIVGVATMAMFIGLISGIIIHKKIFRDFFTFRPQKGQRSWMDMHNISSVLALPFHLMITFSGLLLLMYLLMPWGVQSAYNGDMRSYFEASGGRGGGGTLVLVPVSTALEKAESLTEQIQVLMSWAEENWPRGVSSLRVTNPYDSPFIELRQRGAGSLIDRARSERLQYNVETQQLIRQKMDDKVGFWRGLYNAVTALHLLRYGDSLPRWLFFLGGILGAMMVATGLLLWVEKRRHKVEKNGEWRRMFTVVQILNVTTIVGLPLATVVACWASRLLPVTLAQRELWEIRLFFIGWLISLLYSCIRNNRQRWIEQLALLGLLLLLLPLYNLFFVSGYSLLSVCFDGVFFVSAIVAILACWQLLKRDKSSRVMSKRKTTLLRAMS